jgi:hypothetical protein
MIAAPRLERKLTTGRHEPGEEPCREGVAVVWAAIDWQRAGMTKPLPEELLRELYVNYLLVREVTDGTLERGVAWALRPLYASVSLLRQADGFLPYDHIVAFADRRPVRPIHPASWERILQTAQGEEVFRLGLAASARGDVDRARAAWRLAGESDNEAISAPALINAKEAEGQLVYVKRARDATAAEEREAALTDALLRFGHRFGSSLTYLRDLAEESQAPNPYGALADDFLALFARWLAGDQLTDRADEAERRVVESVALARQNPQLGRLAAQAILALPDGHPERDPTEARRLLVRYLGGAEGSDRQSGMELLAQLIDLEEQADEELAEQVARGLALEPGIDDETVRSFRVAIAGRYRLAERGVQMLGDVERDPLILRILAALNDAAEDDARAG